MHILRDPASANSITNLAIRELVAQRFEDICAGEDYDADLHGFMIVAEPGDSPEALEEESGCPILRSYIGTAQYGDPDFRPVFECLDEHDTCYEMVFVPGDGDFGVVIFIPKHPCVDSDLLMLCAEYAVPAP